MIIPNPYEPPKHESIVEHGTPRFWTHRNVFWMGIVMIAGGIMIGMGSHVLYVETKASEGNAISLILVFDIAAGVAFLLGMFATVVCHWFPNPRRKYSWRRR